MAFNAGSQLIVNGALVTALDPCRLELGSGAVVLAGREVARGKSGADPTRELYFALLKASETSNGVADERYHLFHLLAKVVARYRTHIAQRECALFAAALISGDHEAAIGSARRLHGFHQDRPAAEDAPIRPPQEIGVFP